MTGAELRAMRLARGLSIGAVARQMGVARPRVSNIEALANVTENASTRYLAAMERAGSPVSAAEPRSATEPAEGQS